MNQRFRSLLSTPIAVAAALLSVLEAGSEVAPHQNSIFPIVAAAASFNPELLDSKTIAALAANQLYDSLNLKKLGLSFDALQYAYRGFLQLKEKGALRNESVLSVCDFSQPSSKKRLYVIDVKRFKVLKNTYVAHGRNSGLQYATDFSNTPESLQSSLGFFVTKGTYIGKHGLSLKLEGKERGYNHNAEDRAIVVHGADYIGRHRLGAPYMGRSFGCPAVPQPEADDVINMIKNGTCLFIYHPSMSYLHGSKLLNG